jgi:hypothetical protein
MTPYYRDDWVTLYNADASEGVESGDLLVADPPFDRWAEFVAAVAGNESRSVCAFTSWQHRAHLDRTMPEPRAELAWCFSVGRWVADHLPLITHETVIVYGETGDAHVGRLLPPDAVRKGGASIGTDRWEGRVYTPKARAMLTRAVDIPRNVGDGVWAKPEALMSMLIEWLCPPGGTVVDMCSGSGSTLVVAKRLGRLSVGYELDPDACRAISERLAQDVLGLAS